MKRSRHIHHARHHFAISYPLSLTQRLYTIVLGPLIVIALVAALLRIFLPQADPVILTIPSMLLATFSTMIRIGIAYVLAVIVAIPVALLIERNRTFETVLLPVFDVLESIPNLAILPALIVIFGRFGFLEGAAITILFLNMVWNIVFALVGGLQVIPRDVVYAARVFGLRGFSYVRRLVLPAIFPQFVTGSILAVASGWNIIIVAEALHAYIPNGTTAQDLFGVGSILVATAAQGETSTYIAAFSTMIVVIALFNFFVWQKLLHYSQKFRFD